MSDPEFTAEEQETGFLLLCASVAIAAVLALASAGAILGWW